MSTTQICSADKYQELDRYIDSLPDLQGALVTVLHHAQELYGYLPSDLQLHIARRLGVPASQVYGVVSFYSFFSMVPKGQYRLSICMGTACFVRGSEAVLKEFEKELNIRPGETTEDMLFSIDALRCVGACGLAPVVMVNDKVYGRVTPDQVKGILEEYMAKGGNNDDDQ